MRYFSRKALGLMSYMMVVARCWRMLSMVCLGCCRVTRRYFCSGLAMLRRGEIKMMIMMNMMTVTTWGRWTGQPHKNPEDWSDLKIDVLSFTLRKYV